MNIKEGHQEIFDTWSFAATGHLRPLAVFSCREMKKSELLYAECYSLSEKNFYLHTKTQFFSFHDTRNSLEGVNDQLQRNPKTRVEYVLPLLYMFIRFQFRFFVSQCNFHVSFMTYIVMMNP